MELYRKHRPASFKQMVGNEKTLQSISALLKQKRHPHAFLLSGPAGCGKTTIAYIIAKLLGCSESNLEENNSGNFRGIDTIREITSKMKFRPIGGSPCRIFLLEEGHKLSGDAQEALLKPVEACPEHVYFILTTTNPEKINTALKTRFISYSVELLDDDEIKTLLKRILKKEKLELTDKQLARIIGNAQGSGRRAISMLEKVLSLNGDVSEGDISEDVETLAIELCRLLMRTPAPKWPEVAKMLGSMKEEAESVRRAILGYMRAVLLKSGNAKGYALMTCFSENYYNTGNAGLAMSCFEAVSTLADMK